MMKMPVLENTSNIRNSTPWPIATLVYLPYFLHQLLIVLKIHKSQDQRTQGHETVLFD